MDRHRRELERKAAVGSLAAEAALLLSRLRSGELPEDKLRLAAYLGYSPAAHALDTSVHELRLGESEPPSDAYELSECLSLPGEVAWGFGKHGSECLARFAIAVSDGLLVHLELTRGRGTALNLAEGLLVEGGPAEVEAARLAIPGEIDLAGDDHSTWFSFVEAAGQSLGIAAVVVLCDGYEALAEYLQLRVGSNPGALVEAELQHAAGVTLSCLREPHEDEQGLFEGKSCESVQLAVKAHVRAELVPWALGTGDPVRDRVEARAAQ